MSYAEILQHSISWSFRGEGAPDALDEASEERIAQCIRNGFREGELYVQAEDDGTEYRGWWSIAQPESERVSELEAQVAQLTAELAALQGERDALAAQVAAANAQEPAFWANSGVLSMVKEMDYSAVGLSCRKTPDVDVPLYTTRPIPDAMQAKGPRVTWPKSRDVGRLGDMAPRGHSHMRVMLDADNDVCVRIWEQEGDDGQLAGIEFCCPGIGGGKSPRTREALLALMVAMEEDNATEPRGAFSSDIFDEGTISMQLHTPATHPEHAIIGHTFRAWDGNEYTCDSWQRNLGYWMFRTDENDALVRRNVSERAIGSTFHRIDDAS